MRVHQISIFLPNWCARAVLLAALWPFVAGTATADKLGEVVRARAKGNAVLAQSQVRIDKVSEQTDRLIGEYRSVLQQIDSLRVYNGQLEQLIGSQNEELDSLRGQIENVTVVGRQITPLMLRMIDALEAFVSLDVPFLPDERRERVAGLRELMGRADVADSEKFRRLLEAYQIENEFGRTIEAYRGSLEVGGEARTVDFLRVGRIALLYQTLDAAEAGVWDQEAQQWTRLGSEFRNPIRQGMRIARKQAAPDLIRLPIQSARTVR